jgi:hypothetical protein
MSSHAAIRRNLIEYAKQNGKTVSYSELGKIANLDMDNIADSNKLAEILGDIGSSEHEAARSLLLDLEAIEDIIDSKLEARSRSENSVPELSKAV